jgi:hypothetical protein
MPGADAGSGRRQYLHIEIDEAAQSARIFVIHVQVVNAKIAFFGFFVGHNFIVY